MIVWTVYVESMTGHRGLLLWVLIDCSVNVLRWINPGDSIVPAYDFAYSCCTCRIIWTVSQCAALETMTINGKV
jgi:hypothetical protein